jgi:DNA-binding transcriptional LysR family regulator
MPRNLSQHALQAFHLTVLTGSVSAAAETLCRSQPAVSRLLKELERDVGFRLFDRVKGRLQPTAEARLLFAAVRRSLIGLDRIASVVGEIRQGRRGTVTLAAMPSAASFLPPVLRDFIAARPGMGIALHAIPSEAVVQMILTGGCDLGFINSVTPTPGLQVERRYGIPCACILPPEHRLAESGVIRPEDMEGEALVALSTTTGIGAQLATILEQHGVSKLTKVETHLSSIVSDFVMIGVGIGVVDGLTVAAHVAKGGNARPFEPAVRFEVKVVRSVETELSANLTLLLKLCDQAFASVEGDIRIADKVR